MPDLLVTTFYRFSRITDPVRVRGLMEHSCSSRDVRGIMLVATEGLNATLSGSASDLDQVIEDLRRSSGIDDFPRRTTPVDRHPFRRLRVRCKKEIVTMGVPEVDPLEKTGTRVAPEDWNALLEDPDVVTIDARNDFEVSIGTFETAVDPAIRSFGELPGWLKRRFAKGPKPRIAMFCTGGIRCEKSTAFLRQSGFEHVYQLEGGILAYLDRIPPSESRWRGECFVFDERVAVAHGLATGTHSMCHACGHPVASAERDDSRHHDGISCVHCHDDQSSERRSRLLDRASDRAPRLPIE